MHLSNDEALEIFKWGDRLLYLLLFISCMVAMGYWHTIITYTFLASEFCLILPWLFYKDDDIPQAAGK